MTSSTALALRIVDRRDHRHGKKRHSGYADARRRPRLIESDSAAAVRPRGEPGCRHAHVVHAADRAPHHHRGPDPKQGSLPRIAVAQSKEHPQRHERGRYGDVDGERHECWIERDGGHDRDRRHAHVMHERDARTHHRSGAAQTDQGQFLAPGDGQGESGGQNRHGQRRQGCRYVVCQGHRNGECQHPDEMHGPDAEPHDECTGDEPRTLIRQLRVGDAGRQSQRGVRHADRDEHR